MLADGQGGIGWAGLDVVCAHLGVADVGDLIDRLSVIKAHRPDKEGVQDGARDPID